MYFSKDMRSSFTGSSKVAPGVDISEVVDLRRSEPALSGHFALGNLHHYNSSYDNRHRGQLSNIGAAMIAC